MRNSIGTNSQAIVEYLAARLQRGQAPALHRQLYRALRLAILSAHLPADAALPASRALSLALGLGRNTVVQAYEQLIAEGFCEARPGAGTFVRADALPQTPQGSPAAQSAQPPALAQRAQSLLNGLPAERGKLGAAFVPGLPDLAAFPWAEWQRLEAQIAQRPAWAGYLQTGGLPALRQALASYLPLARGVVADADQILLCQGMQQALDLLARCLADVGEVAWLEEPGYPGARAALAANGLRLQPVPVDEQGLNWQGQTLPAPRLIYVTPSHQYPLGSVMSLPRRQALLQCAAQHGAWIIEDDYDSEFRHHGRPLSALQGLDRSGRVIYLGTFSKVLFPALRLAYMVVPSALVDPLRRLLARCYREPDYRQQAVVAHFIESGGFDRHLRRMRLSYAQRQALLRDTLQAELDQPRLWGGDAGMHLVLQLPAGCDDRALSAALAAQGLAAPALSDYCLATPPFAGLLLGYAGVGDAELVAAARRLGGGVRGLCADMDV